MEPLYMNEKKYSYHVFSQKEPQFAEYQPADPQTDFEKEVHQLFLKGYSYLQKEEFYLALTTFRELHNLILSTAVPTVPIDSFVNHEFVAINEPLLMEIFIKKGCDILRETPIKNYDFPGPVISEETTLPESVKESLSDFETAGLTITPEQTWLDRQLSRAVFAALHEDWTTAFQAYSEALKRTTEEDKVVRASLLHDLSIVSEKAGMDRLSSVKLAQESAQIFSTLKMPEAQVHALETLSGIHSRGDDKHAAEKASHEATALRKSSHLFPVLIGRNGDSQAARRLSAPSSKARETDTSPLRAARAAVTNRASARQGTGDATLTLEPRNGGGTTTRKSFFERLMEVFVPPQPQQRISTTYSLKVEPDVAGATPELMLNSYWKSGQTDKVFRINGTSTTASFSLAGNATANVKEFLQTIAESDDLGLVHGFGATYIETVAYLPHMYFFVIPMAIADCLVGLGNYQEAEAYYTGVLQYPLINKKYELVKLWNKLADLYLEMGDTAYRQAKDSVAQFDEAKSHYEKIVRTNKTLNSDSTLYQDPRLSILKARIAAFIAGGMKTLTKDNPEILSKVMEAHLKLSQIKEGLNFFGFSIDYAPPFSWEYLQTTARYFAQQASQIEQQYIQFKTAAENETLQRQQLDQQAEVARMSVELERRGKLEAQAGKEAAQASLDYATTQVTNAAQAMNGFNAVRDELAEYAELEAWASAASMAADQEVLLTISDYEYYNSDKKMRSDVIADLAIKRTQVTHQMEAARLEREVQSATAYKELAQKQLAQAQARISIAEQRIAIAELQQKNAEENRNFLDMKEFNARLWYDLARHARRISRKYLDMATEIAFLSERAYNAETERNLSIIRYDYSNFVSGGLLGGGYLLLDLDYFTLDYVTTTKTKKAPVKRVISIADSFPMAFQQLKSKGICTFQTDLVMFERQNPGMYLCKTRSVELVFVGINTTSLAGTLRNVGVSKYRSRGGGVHTRHYPPDVMPISRYEVRHDALVFRVDPNDLRLFENNGIDTLWQIDLPLSTNDFDYNEILDVQLVIYYDGFFSPTLENSVKAALPATGSATRAISLSMSYPDELFYLKSKGEAEFSFDTTMFPRNQTKLIRRKVSMKLSGAAKTINGLTLRLKSKNSGGEIKIKTDGKGEVPITNPALAPLKDHSLFDTWTLHIKAADNPSLLSHGDLKGLKDVMIFFEYDFHYR